MINFPNRKTARAFARKRDSYKLVDNGSEAAVRWSVKVLG